MLRMVESFGRSGPAPNPAGELTALPQTPQLVERGACCPLPKNTTTPSAFGLDFRPFGPHSAASPTVFIPPMLMGFDKTLTEARIPLARLGKVSSNNTRPIRRREKIKNALLLSPFQKIELGDVSFRYSKFSLNSSICNAHTIYRI